MIEYNFLDFHQLMLRFFQIIFIILFSYSAANADDIFLTSSSGRIPFSALKGKWIFLSYWASWCPPCLDEIDALNQFYKKHRKNNVSVFAVNYESLTVKEQIAMAKTYHLAYPSLTEDPAKSLKLGDIKNLPAMFVFNPHGMLQDKYYGGQTLNALNHYFRTLKQDFSQEQPLKLRAYKPSV